MLRRRLRHLLPRKSVLHGTKKEICLLKFIVLKSRVITYVRCLKLYVNKSFTNYKILKDYFIFKIISLDPK